MMVWNTLRADEVQVVDYFTVVATTFSFSVLNFLSHSVSSWISSCYIHLLQSFHSIYKWKPDVCSFFMSVKMCSTQIKLTAVNKLWSNSPIPTFSVRKELEKTDLLPKFSDKGTFDLPWLLLPRLYLTVTHAETHTHTADRRPKEQWSGHGVWSLRWGPCCSKLAEIWGAAELASWKKRGNGVVIWRVEEKGGLEKRERFF